MRDLRIVAQLLGGRSLLIAVEGDELPRGRCDPRLYLPVRRYDRRLDELSEPMWWGSWMKPLGAYVEEPDLDAETERWLLDRIEELLR